MGDTGASSPDSTNSSTQKTGSDGPAALTPPEMSNIIRSRRTAVSSESVDHEAMQNWTPPVFNKTPEKRAFLMSVLDCDRLSLLFGHLTKENKVAVINAMQRREVKKSEIIIKQGEMGDYFYIVEDGKFDIVVQRGDAEPKKVAEASCGGSFGELALLYNAPRAATCLAVEDCVVWALDRQTFKMMVVNAENTKKKRYEAFLEGISIFKFLNRYERCQLSDILTAESFEAGDQIIMQGSQGDRFYIVADGECRCTMSEKEGPELEVLRYKRGGYFGELALLCEEPRKASVYAVEQTNLLWIDKTTFDRVLGPIVDILKKNADSYPKYAHFLKQTN